MTKAMLKTLCSAVLLLGSTSAAAAIIYDANVTPNVIFGSGNANGSFTVFQNEYLQLGLRGKLRHNAAGNPENTFNSNGDGSYSFAAGVAPTQASPTAVWSFEWSINTDWADDFGFELDDFSYIMGIDIDPGLATAFQLFDPINGLNPNFAEVRWDHAIGNNGTGNGGGGNFVGSEAIYADALANNNVAQNSWKAHWFFGPGFDPTVDATYNIYLEAFNANGASEGRSEIQIIVGSGGSRTVAEPLSLAIFGVGLLCLFALRRKQLI